LRRHAEGSGTSLGRGLALAAGDRLVDRLGAIEGDVFVPHHGYLARLAGMRTALAEKRFAAVLLESDGRYGVAILNSYDVREALFESPDVF